MHVDVNRLKGYLMKQKVVCLLAGFFIGGFAYGALNTAAIDGVIKKDVLDKQDLAVIDDFVAAGIQEILSTADFSSVANLRGEIVSRANSGHSPQYNPQFIAAAQKSLEKGLAEAKDMPDPNLSSKATMNLIILLDSLDNISLVNTALKMIGDQNVGVRYWAIHAVTSPKLIEEFNTGKAPVATAREIAQRLAAQAKVETSPFIRERIAQFGAAVNVPQAKELFTQIVDERLAKYQSRKVEDFSVDGTLLRLLGDRIAAQDKISAKQFGQLFSYAIEYYINYLDGKVVLDAAQQNQLAAALIMTEGRTLTKLGIPQTSIKKALDKKGADASQALQTAYKELFGDGTTPGKLTTILNATYNNTDGTKRTTPLPLPELPKTTK